MSRLVSSLFLNRVISTGVLVAAGLTISACETLTSSAGNSAAPSLDSEAGQLAAIKEVFDANAEQVPTLTAVGYAVVSSQPGRTDAQKRLMAIRSARMAAMRDLAEQIHGL